MTGVIIEFGADREEFTKLIGTDVKAAIIAARQLFSVPDASEPRLNSSAIDDLARILKDGDVISFYKPSGTKGSN